MNRRMHKENLPNNEFNKITNGILQYFVFRTRKCGQENKRIWLASERLGSLHNDHTHQYLTLTPHLHSWIFPQR